MCELSAGTRLGRYVVRAKLGSGGMADVYLAEDTDLRRRVALKVLPPETAADEQARRRLTREARAAAALEHPHICVVHEVDQVDGRLVIVMQYVEGETLDIRLRRAPLSVDEALALAVQIADGVADAHAHAILHRDLKPGNVMITSRGSAKVMDFGLAKSAGDVEERADAGETRTESRLISTPGTVLGTWPYMSPEQVRGEVLDPRSDIFSLGAMFYEMVAGRRPFEGPTPAAIASAILTVDPLPLARFAPDAPDELMRIISKALRKPVDDRYQTAQDLLTDLRTLREERDFRRRLERSSSERMPPAVPASTPMSGGAAPLTPAPLTPAPLTPAPLTPAPLQSQSTPVLSRAHVVWPAAVAAVLVLVAAGWGWSTWRERRVKAESEAALPRVTALAEQGRFFEAYDLAVAIEPILGDDPRLKGLMPAISATLSVATEPAGARVSLTRFTPGQPSARLAVGTTPLTTIRVPRGDYLIEVAKDGFAPVEQSISARPVEANGMRFPVPPLKVSYSLTPASSMPPGMVHVPGGRYRLTSWERPTDRAVDLAGFYIDKYEVSNANFRQFVTAGGYLKREYRREPITRAGRPLPWEEAMRLFRDRTGLPGPRDWANQRPPEGRTDHPVSGVSWYEAAAYGVFRGKVLPTMFQWEKAARGTAVVPAIAWAMPWGAIVRGEDVGQRANFNGSDTIPVTGMAFGMSPYGAFNMAGNVAEWTRNDTPDGYIATGGGWADPVYTFGQFGVRPGAYRSETIGFRLVQPEAAATGEDGAGRIEAAKEVPIYKAITAAEFKNYADAYRYRPAPLEARVEETVTTPDYTREMVTFSGVGAERVTAYLYLPTHVPRPVQVLHFVPAGDVVNGYRPLTASMDERMVPFVRAGRAAFGVVLRGYIGGPPFAGPPPDPQSVEQVESTAERVNTLRRGLDYLATRDDVDRTRIAFVGPSSGGMLGLIEAAVDDRYRGVVMMGVGLSGRAGAYHPVADAVNFVPFIRPPKLILQGSYDEDTPLITAARPMFDLMRQPKTMVVYDGGHVPTPELMMRVVGEWLDTQLGPVTR